MPQLDTALTLTNFLLTWFTLTLLARKIHQLLTNKELGEPKTNNRGATPTWTLPWT
uniref:ATP synthase complex subunit 8 n=1 Tax=Achalinus meiguensis TaxID=572522 RepID=B6ZC02_ACHME|nr:ATP synthase F0 subunit 8 [Achalinus meiguensis]ACJ14780.1 ATP synthase F0 subunit 8 [Achalinus meiguensis]